MEIKIYVENRSKDIEGFPSSAWFTLPINSEVIKEEFGHEEYKICDCEAPFNFNVEQHSLEYLNKVAELFNEHAGNEALKYSGELSGYLGVDILSFLDRIESVVVYSDCLSWKGYAELAVEELGYFGNLIDEVKGYIDYSSLGRDLSVSGALYQARNGTIINYGHY